MRVALVNDLRMALAALRHVVSSMPEAEVAWTAEDGDEAVRRCRDDTPDLILMDMIMPGTNGVEATRRIMQECPCPIVVVTATVTGNADYVYEALGHGALDAVNTPVLGTAGDMEGAADLIRKIRAVRRLTCSAQRPADLETPVSPTPRALPETGPVVIAIGASTGGPQALVKVLSDLGAPRSSAIVIVQHVDPAFAPGLAQWLEHETGMDVVIAEQGRLLQIGQVALACTKDHLVLDSARRYRYVSEPMDQPYRPSVDVFFESLLRASLSPGVAVLLTGMGRDGAAGLLALRGSGWHTIAQDKDTSVVWGMPGAAVQLDAVVQTLAIDAIGGAIVNAVAHRRARQTSNHEPNHD